MDLAQAVTIWILCVVLGGAILTMIMLWLHRDQPQHAAQRIPVQTELGASLARWYGSATAARSRARVVQSAAALRSLPASLTESRERVCDAVGLWQAAGPPSRAYDGLRPATTAELGAALAAWYAAREEEQRQALLDAGMAGWR